jgi:hypothetical protein
MDLKKYCFGGERCTSRLTAESVAEAVNLSNQARKIGDLMKKNYQK